MIKALNIKDGIIQDGEIDGIPIKINIIEPKGKPNVRTLIPMTEVIGITNHNTGNSSPTATDEMHAKYFQDIENTDTDYVSVHLFVDEDSITQTVPLNEVTYHAGDGRGNGNYHTISIEICENGDITKAELNAQKLNAALILTYQKQGVNLKLYKHQDWSGKYCPHIILERPNGWDNFCDEIYYFVEQAEQEQLPTWQLDGLNRLVEKGIINSPNYWIGRFKEPITVGELFGILGKM